MIVNMAFLKVLVVATLLFGLLALWANRVTCPKRLRRREQQKKEAQLASKKTLLGKYNSNTPQTEQVKKFNDVFVEDYADHYEIGSYRCSCCDIELFSSADKLQSDSAWPCFQNPISRDSILLLKDISYGLVRTAVICNSCETHLGYRFIDGPEAANTRYCINSVSLQFSGRTTA